MAKKNIKNITTMLLPDVNPQFLNIKYAMYKFSDLK